MSAIQGVFEKTGARAATQARVDELVDDALRAAAAAPITPLARDELDALARFVGEREF